MKKMYGLLIQMPRLMINKKDDLIQINAEIGAAKIKGNVEFNECYILLVKQKI